MSFRKGPDCGPPVRFSFIARGKKIELPFEVAKDAERVLDGRRFLLSVLNPAPCEWVVRIIACNTDTSVPGIADLQPTLLDADGNVLTPHGRGSSGQGERSELELDVRQGPGGGPPAKLLLKMPKGTQEIAIPFDFAGKDRVARAK